jgi:hypothetical protein
MEENGFRITFKTYELNYYHQNIQRPKDRLVAETLAIMEANPNSLVMVFNDIIIEELRDASATGDFFNIAYWDFPLYTAEAARINPAGTLTIFPMNNMNTYQNLCVLIRDDLYAQFGRPVRNALDLEQLLRFARSNDPRRAPGILYPNSMRLTGYANALFLHLGGINPLTGAFPYDRYLWVDESGNILTLFEMMDFTAQANGQLAGWHLSGLMDFAFYEFAAHDGRISFMPGGRDMYNYPIILCQVSDLHNLAINRLNGYTLNIFDQPAMYGNANHHGIFVENPLYAVAAPRTDVREFLRFMEWLYEDLAHYGAFFFPESLDTRIVVNNTNIFGDKHRHMELFLTEGSLPELFTPLFTGFPNYQEEMDALRARTHPHLNLRPDALWTAQANLRRNQNFLDRHLALNLLDFTLNVLERDYDQLLAARTGDSGITVQDIINEYILRFEGVLNGSRPIIDNANVTRREINNAR